MAAPYVRLGTVGAVVLLVGLVLIGSGFAIIAQADQSELNCSFAPQNNNCQQTQENAANTTIDAQYVIAGGAIVSGIGIFFVVFAIISIMSRREETARFGGQPTGWAGPVGAPPRTGPIPPPMPPPPGFPPGQV